MGTDGYEKALKLGFIKNPKINRSSVKPWPLSVELIAVRQNTQAAGGNPKVGNQTRHSRNVTS
jgi:hypothetical protein